MSVRKNKYLPFRKRIVYEENHLWVYSIGWLAIMTNRHPMTLRKLETSGVFPKPLFDRDQIDGMYRYYTAAELIGYAQILCQYRLKPGFNSKAYNKQMRATMKHKLHEFRLELKKRVEAKSPSALIPSLPNEQSIYKAISTPKERNLKQTAERILNKQNETKE